jgi:hypothetical protein
MTSAAANPLQRKNRLERYRRLTARLDPTGDPAQSMASSYVASPASVSKRIAGELALSPASSHLLIGGIGSGKTTELLAVQAQLPQIDEGMRGMYIDISKDNDIARMTSSWIMLEVGSALASMASGPDAMAEAREYRRALQDVEGPLPSLEPLLTALLAPSEHLVVLLDGLDRMDDMQAFDRAITLAMKTLNSLGVGVVLVGPLRALYGLDRALTERFNSLHYQPWIDSAHSTDGQAFLVNVLNRRVSDDAFGADTTRALVDASGGVVRDLLVLAQAACVEAYLDGADDVGQREVAAAIDSFGRKHLQGLRPAEIEVLQRVRVQASFVQTSEQDLALLMTRRVLEYRTEHQPRYAVHPTIEKLLAELAAR